MAATSRISSDEDLSVGLLTFYKGVNQELLRRAATVRTFDQDLFDRVLAREVPASPDLPMSFEQLVQQPFVALLPGQAPSYQVEEPFRQAFVSTWGAGSVGSAGGGASFDLPVALRDFSRRLVAYYDERGLELDAIYHLLAVNRTTALSRFVARFDASDAAFDLPRCHLLIRLLEERRALLGRALAAAFSARKGRLAARSRWALEYYATENYYQRPLLAGVLDRLIANEREWLLHLVAPGGLGKTTFLRWVIARRCLVEGIPVAHIDFDFVPHMADVVGEPWRLLLHIAGQLNDQLPDWPFRGLIESNQIFTAQAGSQQIKTAGDLVRLSDSERAVKQDEVLTKFKNLLADSRGARPVLFILDTLENLAHRRVDLAALFRLLREIHDDCAGLRVILAGRVNMAELKEDDGGQSDFLAAFAGCYQLLPLTPLAPQEARAFLIAQQQLTDDAIVQAIVEKGDGIPFKLKLLADLVRENPSLTVDAILQYADADLAALIDRVIGRIGDPENPSSQDIAVRWLIRYGVTPHVLTLDYARAVILPHLVEIISGGSGYDDPTDDDLPESVRAREPWRALPGDESLDIERLWQRLKDYTAEASWISTAADVPEAVVFPAYVRDPMRYLLRRQYESGRDVLLRLHCDSLAYFEALAEVEPDPARRGQWQAEAVYHKYQTGDADASAYWRQRMDAAVGQPQTQLALAREVLRPPEEQFGSDARSVKSHRDRPLPTYAADVKALASLQLAYRDVVAEPLARAGLVSAEQALRRAEQLNEKAGGGVLPLDKLAFVRGRILLGNGKTAEAIQTATGALNAEGDRRVQIDVLTLLADAFEATGQADASDYRRRAYEAAQIADPPQRGRLGLKLVRSLRRAERFDEAVGVLESLLNDRAVAGEEAYLAYLALIQTHAALGEDAAAVAAGEKYGSIMAELRLPDGSLLASVPWYTWAARCEIDLARQSADQTPDPPTDNLDPIGEAGLLALGEVTARRAAGQGNVTEAGRWYEDLAQRMRGQPEEARCYHACERLYLDWLEDYNQSQHYAEIIGQTSPDGATAVRAELTAWRRIFGRDGADAVRAQALTFLERERPRLAPALLTETLVHLVIVTSQFEERLPEFVEALKGVASPAQRLALLRDLSFCPSAAERDLDIAGLLALLPRETDPKLDAAVACLRLGHVHRVFGARDTALRLFAQAAELGAERPAVLLQIYRGMDLLGTRLDEATLRGMLDAFSAKEWPLSLRAPFLFVRAMTDLGTRVLAQGGGRALLDEVLAAIPPQSPAAMLWAAPLAWLGAESAALAGNVDSAVLGFSTAAELYTARDDPRTASAMAAKAPAKEPVARDVGFDEGGSGLTANTTSLDVKIVRSPGEQWYVEVSDRTGQTRTGQPASDPTLTALAGLPQAAFNVLIREIGKGDQASALALGALLKPVWDAASESSKSVDLAIRASVEATGLPYEWALFEQPGSALGEWDRLRYIYRVYSSGQTSGGMQKKVMLVLGESAATSLYAQTRSYEEAGLDLVQAYRSAGIDPVVVYGAREATLRLGDVKPSVIHFATGFQDQRGRIGLVFSQSRVMTKQAYPLKADMIDSRSMVDLLGSARLAPLVIVDAPTPPTLTEQVEQFYLRNCFVAEWVARVQPGGIGLPGAILATGLASPADQQENALDLIRLLAQGPTVGELARIMRLRQPAGPGKLMQLATQLYTSDPEARFPVL